MNKRNTQGLLEENADLRLQLYQQREEINHLQNCLQIEIRTNNVLNALKVPPHKCPLCNDDKVNHCERHHQHQLQQQLHQLEAKFRSELRDTNVKVMDLVRMLQQKDKEMFRMKTDMEAVIRRHKVIVKELQQKKREWRSKYTALDFSIRAEQSRKCTRDKAYSESYQEVSSTGEEEETEEDTNVEGEDYQVVGLSHTIERCLSLHQQPLLYIS